MPAEIDPSDLFPRRPQTLSPFRLTAADLHLLCQLLPVRPHCRRPLGLWRPLRHHRRRPLPPRRGFQPRLRRTRGGFRHGEFAHCPEEVFDALKNQTVDLVLTAHPTQAVRRSLLQKHSRITDNLAQLNAKDITPDDKQELDVALQREIQAAFRTDEIKRTPPTPQDEMRAGMSYFHETIWKGVPKFLRRVDTALKNIGINERVPYNAPLIQFSSWMGGDRDGNPRVTPEVTRDVCLLARMMAANLYYSQIEDLMFELECSVLLDTLEQSACNPKLASILLKSLLRILQVAVEQTLASFKSIDAIARVLKVACIQAQEARSLDHIQPDSEGNNIAKGIELKGNEIISLETVENWYECSESSLDLFTKYVSVEENAKSLVLHSSSCIDCLFDLFWEEHLRKLVLEHILGILKLPTSTSEDRRAKLQLCSKYLETFTRAKEKVKCFAELSIHLLVSMREIILIDLVSDNIRQLTSHSGVRMLLY